MKVSRDAGSFRDPAGWVFEHDRRIYRVVTRFARQQYEDIRGSGLLTELADRGWLPNTDEVEPASLGVDLGEDVAHLVRHARVPFVSYPYEWSFSLLQSAALLHLDLHIWLLNKNFTLSDATAYNIQFEGPKPIFIDLLSITRYEEGQYWLGHRQFCEQFLAPLILNAYCGIPHNDWYRGALEGISLLALQRILPASSYLSWPLLFHVVLQAKAQQRSIDTLCLRERPTPRLAKVQQRPLPKATLLAMLNGLRRWISRLRVPRARPRSVWQNYVNGHTYEPPAERIKERFVADFVAREKPHMLWDLGCNSGTYSDLSIRQGARLVIGFDMDVRVLDVAHKRALDRQLCILPLYLDAANPTPSQGWRQQERKGFEDRGNADAVLALAFVHHLAIARNVPLDQVVDWTLRRAPTGVIDFVGKNDPTVRYMLSTRRDIFDTYTQGNFESILAGRSRITHRTQIPGTDRTLYSYRRDSSHT